MRLYNTLTRQKEELIPVEPGKIKMYVCGPTVYNYIHIGNARPYIAFDAVRRYLEYRGYDVTYIQNFTDVDDKIIKYANETGQTANEVVEYYIAETLKDADGLNVKRATAHPRVTEEMDSIIELIGELVSKGHAYEVDGTVYFDAGNWENYGKLSKKVLDELELGSRIAVDEEKKNPMDFILWKPKKEGEPAWESPWGDGRPGWHIECSAMSKKYLGDTIDIHAGGEDLVFPHHENEIAQSEAASGKLFAKYWIHNSFLNMDNRKMSKSLGNFFTLREVAEKFGYEVVRFFMLNAHYRSPVSFSEELMESAKSSLERLQNCKINLGFYVANNKEKEITREEADMLGQLPHFETKFHEAMEDDFNTADAISSIFEMVKWINMTVKDHSSVEFTQKVYNEFIRICDILGIFYDAPKRQNDQGLSEDEIETLIQKRTEAKKEKDFALADAVRDELLEKGISIEDTRQGVRWKRL
ncbi:MAG TPA: cysteine--tRNA ligase [Epulopiscium sp.]|nr:cysteine--tRNA ligase [Candidatus Epulonipiscium sp.]